MSESTQQMMDRIAKHLARKYASKCWYVDARDLEQAAHAQMIYALSKYEAEKGREGSMPLPAWLWLCAKNAVAAEVMKHSSPVTSTHRRSNAIGTSRASLRMEGHGKEGEGRERPELVAHVDIDEQYAACQRSEYVQRRLTELVGDQGRVFALKYLSHMDGEVSAEKVAEKSNVPVGRVYAYSRKLLACLREDAVLHELWKEA